MIGKTILTSLSKYPSMRKNVILAAVLSSLISCGSPETNEGNNFDCHVCAFIWPSCHDDCWFAFCSKLLAAATEGLVCHGECFLLGFLKGCHGLFLCSIGLGIGLLAYFELLMI